MNRLDVLTELRAKRVQRIPIIGGGAGTGLSAKFEEAGGIDLIVIYNSGRFRMAGRGSLSGLMPYGNANQIVKEMACEVLPVVRKTPVLAGICATDPFLLLDPFLDDLRRLGFSGVQNFPTVGLIDGNFRKNLEETGMGYELEVDSIRAASEKDLLTTPYVFSPEDATAMAKAGADVLVAHMGLTAKGSIGAQSALSLEDCVSRIEAICEAGRSVNSDIFVLCHGGPIAEPSDAQFIFDHCCGIDGFYGASSMERLPTEVAIKQQTKSFVKLSLQTRS